MSIKAESTPTQKARRVETAVRTHLTSHAIRELLIPSLVNDELVERVITQLTKSPAFIKTLTNQQVVDKISD